MSVRKVVTASVAALALAVVSVPMVSAQDEGSGTGALSVEGLLGGSLEDGNLSSGSGDGQEEGGEGASDSGSSGSVDALGSEDSSLANLVPDTGEVCDLPSLGGSLAKFYPLFGISGVPTSVIKFVTDALGSVPNLLKIVAGQGAGAALLGQTGSMNEALCTSIFGGKMVLPPVTVIVDGDGTPITTITGTVPASTVPSRSTSTSTLPATTTLIPADESSSGSPLNQSDDSTEQSGKVEGTETPGAETLAIVRPTEVPVSGN